MTKKELLTSYREISIEVEELQHQLNRVGITGRPAGVASMRTDRISRGTNDPEAAAMQLADGLEAMLANKQAELAELSKEVDALLAGIRDFRTYLIIYHYYVLGHTDEQVAHKVSMSKSRVNQLRVNYLRCA